MKIQSTTDSGIPGVKGRRTEGWLLQTPCERITPKSMFLRRLEQAQEQRNDKERGQ